MLQSMAKSPITCVIYKLDDQVQPPVASMDFLMAGILMMSISVCQCSQVTKAQVGGNNYVCTENMINKMVKVATEDNQCLRVNYWGTMLVNAALKRGHTVLYILVG